MPTLAKDDIEWAIEHLHSHADTDIFPRPFEIDVLHHHKDEVVKTLASKDVSQWSANCPRRCLVPKDRLGFRVATQLDPLDAVLYVALCHAIGDDLEALRTPVSKGVRCSHRYAPDDATFSLFDRSVSYAAFEETSRKLCGQHEFIAVTDIADFYPRIYLHRIESTFARLPVASRPYANAVVHLIKGWNQNVSYGIPVGSQPSRLIAEAVIDDVDRGFLAEGATFIRFVDDYRIFCSDRPAAIRRLASLADRLYRSHGLALQASKTRIYKCETYVEDVIDAPRKLELRMLSERFSALLGAVGVWDPYSVPALSDLPSETRQQLNALNLDDLLSDLLKDPEYDVSLARYLIRRQTQIASPAAVTVLLTRRDCLHPVVSDVVRYLARVAEKMTDTMKATVARWLRESTEPSLLGQLVFHRALLLAALGGPYQAGVDDDIVACHQSEDSDLAAPAATVAIARAGLDWWFRDRKASFGSMRPWERRAFLYGATCLPKDEYDHFVHALKGNLSPLETWTAAWAKQHRIS